jgi:hypothetical protein
MGFTVHMHTIRQKCFYFLVFISRVLTWPLIFRREGLVLLPPRSLLEDAVDVLGDLL